jgi:hypothetical protein
MILLLLVVSIVTGGSEPPLPDPAEPASKKLVESARKDLAKRLSIPASEIALVEFRKTTWPDGSLGCPQPGMMYTQMVQDGTVIRLTARKRTYEYHSGTAAEPVLCEKNKPKPMA